MINEVTGDRSFHIGRLDIVKLHSELKYLTVQTWIINKILFSLIQLIVSQFNIKLYSK